jgi:hypothetical protein
VARAASSWATSSESRGCRLARSGRLGTDQ